MLPLCLFLILGTHLALGDQINFAAMEDVSGSPGIVKHEGYYYSIVESKKSVSIYKSSDLQNWQILVDNVVNENNFPVWANEDYSIFETKLHVMSNDNFRIYFSARTSDNFEGIGVLFSNFIEGPYYSLGKPFPFPKGTVTGPVSLLNDGVDLYMVYVYYGGEITARQLTKDGLSFAKNDSVLLIKPTLGWEATWIGYPNIVARNGYNYLFYGQGMDCTYQGRIGVSRSESPLGPYTKFGDPILDSKPQEYSPSITSIVENMAGNSDMLVYTVLNGDCKTVSLLTADLEYRNTGWPSVKQG